MDKGRRNKRDFGWRGKGEQVFWEIRAKRAEVYFMEIDGREKDLSGKQILSSFTHVFM